MMNKVLLPLVFLLTISLVLGYQDASATSVSASGTTIFDPLTSPFWRDADNVVDETLGTCSTVFSANRPIVIRDFDFSGFSEINTNGDNIKGIEIQIKSAYQVNHPALVLHVEALKAGVGSIGSTTNFNPTWTACTNSVYQTVFGSPTDDLGGSTKAELDFQVTVKSGFFLNPVNRYLDDVRIIVHLNDDEPPRPDEIIGGEIIPIDQTALLLAGVQSISMWMIPVVIAGAGIGVFVIKRRK